MKYTNDMKLRAEKAIWTMSEKAKRFESGTSPLDVYAYETEDGFRFDYFLGKTLAGEGLTFEEIEEAFEDLGDEVEDGEE